MWLFFHLLAHAQLLGTAFSCIFGLTTSLMFAGAHPDETSLALGELPGVTFGASLGIY
jgi:hypothetical protein